MRYFAAVTNRCIRLWHHVCVKIMPIWKLKQLLRETPYQEVRREIWKQLGNLQGEGAYINRLVTLVDSPKLEHNVILGARATFSPNVTFITSAGPNNSLLKDMDCCQRFIKQGTIYVGDDTWIGAGVIILPGISIGKRCVIGAGSVVTHDIPDDSLAYGVPCRVERKLKE